jgi:hypothetical protein
MVVQGLNCVILRQLINIPTEVIVLAARSLQEGKEADDRFIVEFMEDNWQYAEIN